MQCIITHEPFRYVNAGMGFLGVLASYVLMVAILEDRGVTEEREIWPSAVMLPIIMLQVKTTDWPAYFVDLI